MLDATIQDMAFDYLIVGGGTAGCCLAARLSEDPNVVVGLIEAGSRAKDHATITDPERFAESLGTSVDYGFETVKQRELGGRRISCPRGKGLGGTSLLNLMVWTHAPTADFDRLAGLGLQGWDAKTMKSLYQKSECYEAGMAYNATKSDRHELFYGKGGPVSLCHDQKHCASDAILFDTITNLEHANGQSSDQQCSRLITCPLTVDAQARQRMHSARAFLERHSSRHNLHVFADTQCDNIVLGETTSGLVANGVSIVHDGHPATLKAKREVIICAGTYGSPLLLERSGIGDPTYLGSAGIETRIGNEHVGSNLQDHPMVALTYEVNDPAPTMSESQHSVLQSMGQELDRMRSQSKSILSSVLAYLDIHRHLSNADLKEALGTTSSRKKDDATMSQYAPDPSGGQVEYILLMGHLDPFPAFEAGKNYVTLLQILQYPFSSGFVHAGKGNPHHPEIHPRLFEDQGHIDLALHQLYLDKLVPQIEQTEPFRSLIGDRVWPTSASSEQLIRDHVVFDWHPVGTCAMDAVVDERLKVKGTSNLRIVDASVLPYQIGAHPQATIYAIAEKAAEMIKEDSNAV